MRFSENALSHVVRHSKNDLNKDFHGIFKLKDDIDGTLDNAYSKLLANSGVLSDATIIENGTVVIQKDNVVCTLGGHLGDLSNLDKIKLYSIRIHEAYSTVKRIGKLNFHR